MRERLRLEKVESFTRLQQFLEPEFAGLLRRLGPRVRPCPDLVFNFEGEGLDVSCPALEQICEALVRLIELPVQLDSREREQTFLVRRPAENKEEIAKERNRNGAKESSQQDVSDVAQDIPMRAEHVRKQTTRVKNK